MKEIHTEIVIEATTGNVWEVLTDFKSYTEWNPFIISIVGDLKKGSRITTKMLNGEKEMSFEPIITIVDLNKKFEWLGSGMMGMFKGRHYFTLEDLGSGQTKLIHGEKFSGLLSGIVMKMIGDNTIKGFQNMNRALKMRVES